MEIEPYCYAVHQTKDGWEIIAPSDDPCAPAYWRVGVVREYGLGVACGLQKLNEHRG
jgi:hypothetical protein